MTYGQGMKLDDQAVTDKVKMDNSNEPCPFCGCSDIVFVHHKNWVKVSCDDCGASTGDAFNEPVALVLWNSRVDAWKEMSVTEIAASNKNVYDYIKQLENDE